jgi:2'-5' RNA ligase
MCPDPQPTDPINSYSLVGYVPGQLGLFLDQLRRDLVNTCFAQSHVTVLPPRPLVSPPEQALQAVREVVPTFAPFEVEMTGISIFPVTNVIYAEIGRGREELLQMHERLNREVLHFHEPFEYHPHITLAQNLELESFGTVLEKASEAWRQIPSHRFVVDRLVWVQNTLSNRWIDLLECELKGVPALKR